MTDCSEDDWISNKKAWIFPHTAALGCLFVMQQQTDYGITYSRESRVHSAYKCNKI